MKRYLTFPESEIEWITGSTPEDNYNIVLSNKLTGQKTPQINITSKQLQQIRQIITKKKELNKKESIMTRENLRRIIVDNLEEFDENREADMNGFVNDIMENIDIYITDERDKIEKITIINYLKTALRKQ